jgi:hypothetical protein
MEIHKIIPIPLILAEFQPKPAQLDFAQKFTKFSTQTWSKFDWNHRKVWSNCGRNSNMWVSAEMRPKLAVNYYYPALVSKITWF